jgi:enoyl-CoA hydratase/carnithine racemase
LKKFAEAGVKGQMGECLLAFHKSKKPTIAVVRGGCVGIAFTTLCLADFIYVAPDAFF